LIIYDITGKEVKKILNNINYNSGKHKIQFNSYGLSSGIYFYKLSVNDFNDAKRMVLLK
jgi:hypothetical protein